MLWAPGPEPRSPYLLWRFTTMPLHTAPRHSSAEHHGDAGETWNLLNSLAEADTGPKRLAGLPLSKRSIWRTSSSASFFFFWLFQLEARVLEMFCIVILSNWIPDIVEMYFKNPQFYESQQLAWINCTCWWRAMLRPRRKLRLIFQEERDFPVNTFTLQWPQIQKMYHGTEQEILVTTQNICVIAHIS